MCNHAVARQRPEEAAVSESVRREQLIPADRDEVWAALTEPEGLESWLAREAELELEPGGELRFEMPDGELRDGFVEEASPPERLSFWWRGDGEDAPLTRVELTLEDAEEGTLLRVVETRQILTVEAAIVATGSRGGSAGPPTLSAAARPMMLA
jgi:uncharacterized protein YndB with AHSA1/START domain